MGTNFEHQHFEAKNLMHFTTGLSIVQLPSTTAVQCPPQLYTCIVVNMELTEQDKNTPYQKKFKRLTLKNIRYMYYVMIRKVIVHWLSHEGYHTL